MRKKNIQKNRKQSRYYKYYYRKNFCNWLGSNQLAAISKTTEVIHSLDLRKCLIGIKYIEKSLNFLYCMPVNRSNFDFWYEEAVKYAISKIKGESSKRAAKEIKVGKISTVKDVEEIVTICLRASNIPCEPKKFVKKIVLNYYV